MNDTMEMVEWMRSEMQSLWERIQGAPFHEKALLRKRYARAYELYKRQCLLVHGSLHEQTEPSFS